MSIERFTERLEDVLVRRKIASYRSVRNLLRRHTLTVNGERVLSKGTAVCAGRDTIALDGIPLEIPADIYLMMNKPASFECTHGKGRYETIFSLLPQDMLHPEFLGTLHTVGRLDVDTEGLLIFTTNGTLSHALSMPASGVEKTYGVSLRDEVPLPLQQEYVHQCAAGIRLDAEWNAPEADAAPSVLVWKDERTCELTVTEGKYHEVKRIFKALGNEVSHLKRLSLGGVGLDGSLASGAYRPLTDKEIDRLLHA